ncbi:MAG: DMT family transporter [Candidatus Methylacidiphilales bacterium]
MTNTFLLLPLLAGMGYAVAAILLKRCLAAGIDPWAVIVWSNLGMALVFAPMLLGAETLPGWEHVGRAVVPGVAFFLGQIFTFFALSKGDASVATPILSTKIILVALLTVILLGEPLGARIWVAAILATGAVALIQRGRAGGHGKVWLSVVLGLTSATAFALCDILIQRDAPRLDPFAFIPMVFAWVGLASLMAVPWVGRRMLRVPRGTRGILPLAVVILAVQCLAMAVALGFFGRATEVNIVYSTRGIWTVVLVWCVGPWLGNWEREQGAAVMANRLAGSALLLGAIFLVLV